MDKPFGVQVIIGNEVLSFCSTFAEAEVAMQALLAEGEIAPDQIEVVDLREDEVYLWAVKNGLGHLTFEQMVTEYCVAWERNAQK